MLESGSGGNLRWSMALLRRVSCRIKSSSNGYHFDSCLRFSGAGFRPISRIYLQQLKSFGASGVRTVPPTDWLN